MGVGVFMCVKFVSRLEFLFFNKKSKQIIHWQRFNQFLSMLSLYYLFSMLTARSIWPNKSFTIRANSKENTLSEIKYESYLD